MILEPPAPPTVPAPAVRPTPPTPPRIDMSPFKHSDSSQGARKVDTPETMARDAVANGAGALTKRTVEKNTDEENPPNQTVTVIPPDAPLTLETQADYDRGQGVLKEFRDLDAQEAKSSESLSSHASTRQTSDDTPRPNQDDGHGAFYWLFTVVFVIVAAGVFGRKFLYTERRARVRTPHFDGLANKKSAADKSVTPPTKPATPPSKQDDDKGKHFEVRV